jgi:xanthine dehydrogenase accessory factor
MLVRADGSTLGTLGGGCIEADAHAAAIDALSTGGPRLLDFELTEDIAVDYGLACGGQERILIAPMGHGGGLDRVAEACARGGRRGALTLVRADDATAGRIAAVWTDGTSTATSARGTRRR